MNIKTYLILVLLIITAGTFIYRTRVHQKTTYAFIALSNKESGPGFLRTTNYLTIYTYLPRIAKKILATLTLSELLDPDSVYKIITPESFDPTHTENCIELSKLDQESGFIHAALANQVEHILEKFFKENSTVLLLELNLSELKNAGITIKKEQNKPQGEFFPHLYGTQRISLAIIKNVVELDKINDSWNIETINRVIPCLCC